MPHSDVRLLTCPDGYKLGLGKDTSELVDFGEPLEWEAPNGKTYLAFCDLPEGKDEAENVESLLDSWVYEVKPLAHVEPEDEGDGEVGDVEEDDDEDEDEDAGEGGGDGEGDEVDTPTAGLDPDDEDEDEDEEPIYE